MTRITADYLIAAMDKSNAPAARCHSGETVIFETLDCSGGAVSREGKRDTTPGKYILNPATGPLYVENAQPGDVLAVEIVSLKNAPWGFMGSGKKEHLYGTIDVDFPVRIFDVSSGKVSIGGKSFPVNPMVGVIGVAPAGDGICTLVPSFHGGNMDCTRVREGSTIYFPVFVPGALLAMGDLHAAMGDGEVFVYALETAGEVTVNVKVIKGKSLRMPVVIDRGVLAVIASAPTLEECNSLALGQLFDIMIENGWDRNDAGYMLSLKCNLAICQIVDPNMTVRAEMPLDLLRAH